MRICGRGFENFLENFYLFETVYVTNPLVSPILLASKKADSHKFRKSAYASLFRTFGAEPQIGCHYI